VDETREPSSMYGNNQELRVGTEEKDEGESVKRIIKYQAIDIYYTIWILYIHMLPFLKKPRVIL